MGLRSAKVKCLVQHVVARQRHSKKKLAVRYSAYSAPSDWICKGSDWMIQIGRRKKCEMERKMACLFFFFFGSNGGVKRVLRIKIKVKIVVVSRLAQYCIRIRGFQLLKRRLGEAVPVDRGRSKRRRFRLQFGQGKQDCENCTVNGRVGCRVLLSVVVYQSGVRQYPIKQNIKSCRWKKWKKKTLGRRKALHVKKGCRVVYRSWRSSRVRFFF
jgi:hypothetical protein